MTSDLRRAAIVQAEEWLGTRYHHMGRVKGAGVDCCTFLIEVYTAVGVVPPGIEMPYYRPDFMQHNSDETYLDGLLQYARPVKIAGMADLALFKMSRVYAHAAIVVEWPRVIHASWRIGVTYTDATQGELGRLGRLNPVRFLSPF